jgi:uncharacterized membrane protein
MLKFISKHILTGLVATLPVILTLYLLYWFVVSTEAVLGDLIRLWLPANLYRPGMGVIAGLAAAFAVGLLMHAYVVQRLFAMGERLLYKTPMVRLIYPALRDFLNYFSPDTKKEFDQVVAVTLGDTGMQVIGFVTQANPGADATKRHPTGRHEHGGSNAVYPDCRRHRRHHPQGKEINRGQIPVFDNIS